MQLTFDFRLIHRCSSSLLAVYRSKHQQHSSARPNDAVRSPPHADATSANANDAPAARNVDEREDSLVIKVVNNYSSVNGESGRGRSRGGGQRGRGRGWQRGRGASVQHVGNTDGAEQRRAYTNLVQEQGSARGGFQRGPERGKPRNKKGWVEWEAEQAEKEAARRSNRAPATSPRNPPINAEILGRAIIVTTSEREQHSTQNYEPAVTSHAEATSATGASRTEGSKNAGVTERNKRPAKLSQHSEGSWETCDEDNGDVSSDDDETNDGANDESMLEAPEIADEYVEDDYFDDGLQLHDQSPVAAATPLSQETSHDVLQRSTDSIRRKEGVRERRGSGDAHNSSAESLERFIEEHTLRLDDNTGCSFEAAAAADEEAGDEAADDVISCDEDDNTDNTGATVSATDSVDSKTLLEETPQQEENEAEVAAQHTPELRSDESAAVETDQSATNTTNGDRQRHEEDNDLANDKTVTDDDAVSCQEAQPQQVSSPSSDNNEVTSADNSQQPPADSTGESQQDATVVTTDLEAGH